MSDGHVCISCQITALQSEESKDRRIMSLEQRTDVLYSEVVRLRLACQEMHNQLREREREAARMRRTIVEQNAALERKAG